MPTVVNRPAYAITINLGRLVFQVFAADASEMVAPALLRGAPAWVLYLHCVWPISRGGIGWPPPHIVQATQFDALATRFGAPRP